MEPELNTMPVPDRLLCEYTEHPLMIDVPDPRFSWRVPAGGEDFRNALHQRAYEIEVYADTSGERMPVWKSGRAAGSEPFGVHYGGNNLQSFSAYRWRVRIWMVGSKSGDRERPGVFSDWAFFETAALNQSDLAASWITHPNPERYLEGEWESGTPHQRSDLEKSTHYRAFYCSFRPEIENPCRIVRARALVCGLGLFRFYINGKAAGKDILSPAQTDFRVRALYNVYDITEELQGEGNPLLTLVLGNGRHIALYGFGKPRGYVQIRIELDDGQIKELLSNGEWIISQGPVRENSIFNGEYFDARVPAPWQQGGEEGGVKAETVSGPPLRAAMIPPITIGKRVPCVDFWDTGDGFIFDLGENISGMVELDIDIPEGTIVKIRHGESIYPDRTLNPSSNREARAEDTYIASGGRMRWHPSFTYHGFRYVELKGFPGVPSPGTVCGLFVHTRAEQLSVFRPEHPLLDKIHEAVLRGQLSNLMGIPTDSPQRDERHGWLGDAHLSAEECLMNFFPIMFYEKFLQDIADTQNPDGSITDVAPKFWMDKPADPAWGAAFISIAWYLYWYAGDRAVLEKHYDSFKNYLGFLDSSRSQASGLIETLGTFGDWCAPGLVVPKKTSLSFTSTWYALHDTALMFRIADLLGRGDDREKYRLLQASLTNSINRVFFKGDRYETFPLSPWDFPDQTSQALALSSDLVPEEVRGTIAALLDRLVTQELGDHVGTGIHGTRYLLTALSENGYQEKAFSVAVQESYPGWGYMIREGATTLWERWEKLEVPGMNSHNHIMLGSIDVWFFSSIAGIQPVEAGWKRIAFRPGRYSRLEEVTASCPSPYGPVCVHWKRDYDGNGREILRVEMGIPSGCSGDLYLPEGEWGLSGISDEEGTAGPSGPERPIRIGSGTYKLELRDKKKGTA